MRMSALGVGLFVSPFFLLLYESVLCVSCTTWSLLLLPKCVSVLHSVQCGTIWLTESGKGISSVIPSFFLSFCSGGGTLQCRAYAYEDTVAR